MKFLIIGLGSMGKRRIRNLQHLKAGEIAGFDPRPDRCQEAQDKYGIITYEDFEKAMNMNPDVLIISTPPDRHVDYALMAARHDKNFFMEASVILDGMDELIKLCQGRDIVAAPSCTMRFHPAIKEIKRLVNNGDYGEVVNFSYHFGQYLPDWHPWEKVSDYYVGDKDTGGGRELVSFELTWLVDIVGYPDKAVALYGKTRDVGADIDDTYAISFAFKGAFGNLLVDVTSRYATRSLILNMENGQVLWRWDENFVKLYDATTKKWANYELNRGTSAEGYNPNIIEEMYIDEMESFINAVKGKSTFENSLEDDARVLRLLYQLEGNL
jgi:predicted dehydrogenase